MPLKEDWELWKQERANFSSRDPVGLTKDLVALHDHIMRLQSVCPKDKAGWPVGNALKVLDKLRNDYNRFKGYLDQLR